MYWQKFLEETKQYVVWLDYSQNISLTPKFEVQSAHFSGKQHTLHDALIRAPGFDKYRYIYHIGNDTNHDNVMTSMIIMDIIREHPEMVSSGHLVLRSDNCSTQYKSRFVFQNLLDMAKNQKIIITWFYGEAGHDRGLIDAMAWFGCKGPLREAIVSRDKWFSTASSMVEYLSKHFESDDSKEYFLLDEEEAAQKRAEGCKEHPVKGCQAAHVLSFHPNGSIFKRNIIDGSEDMMNLMMIAEKMNNLKR